MKNEKILYEFICSVSPLISKENIIEKTISFLVGNFNASCFFDGRKFGNTTQPKKLKRFDFRFVGKQLSLYSEKIDPEQIDLINMLLHISENFISYSEIFKKSKHFAITDSLTGLYNKAYFMRILRNMKNRNEKFCVAMLDLDDFKKFNDTFGHQQGDLVLKRVGEILKDSLVPGEFACRYGGEEFCIILKSNIDIAYKRMEMIRKKIAMINGIVTASIGLIDSCEGPFHVLIKKADSLMYKAKKKGKNRVVIKEKRSFLDRLHGLLKLR